MRPRTVAAIVGALALSLLGLVAVNPASAQTTTPPGACDLFTNNSGQGFSIMDNGHNTQATTIRDGQCFGAVNPKMIGGVTYFQLEDPLRHCLNEGVAGKVYLESCSADAASELIKLTGTNDNELEFKADSEYITTSAVGSGEDVIQSASGTATEENQWEYSNSVPVEQMIPVDFNGPTSSDWTTIEDSAPASEVESAVLEICDPLGNCGGAATEKNTAWDSTLGSLYLAGVRPLYYISTDYGAASLSTLETDISNAESWYGSYDIGFMLDEVSGTSADQSYYQDLYNYIDGTGAGDLNLQVRVMMNAGTPPSVNYIFGKDEILQVFENSETDWTNGSFFMPSWAASYCTCDFAAIISGATSSSYRTDIQDAEKDGVGNVYVDDETASPPPYNTLPSFFAAETAYTASYDPGQTRRYSKGCAHRRRGLCEIGKPRHGRGADLAVSPLSAAR
jgi:hypothetical protein